MELWNHVEKIFMLMLYLAKKFDGRRSGRPSENDQIVTIKWL